MGPKRTPITLEVEEMRKLIEESFADQRPTNPAQVVFKRLHAHNARVARTLAQDKKAESRLSQE